MGISQHNERSLRVMLPDFYKVITKELEDQFNIHPYDMQIAAIEEDNRYNVKFYFGEGFSHQESHFFSRETIQSPDDHIKDFVDEFGESCKQAMIADYYKMLKL